jgi:hypothetical protein
LLPVFALSLFLSATLLFLVQPLVSKMVLPLLGGTPAVWNTCMVFFQMVLLAGYAYSHLTPRWLGVRRQSLLHLALLILIALTLPLSLPQGWNPPTETNPVFWLLLVLALAVGLPFFIISTTAPLLQKWFAHTDHAAAQDPYFLYGASNLGSMAALAGYPLVVEPSLHLASQARLWTWGYGLLVAMVALCAWILWRSPAAAAPAMDPVSLPDDPNQAGGNNAAPTHSRRLWWVLLSFAPSSLMLGVTSYITTDLAAVPLLWVLPLGLYLLTFVLIFARRPLLPHWLMVQAEPYLVILVVICLAVNLTGVWLLFPLHLAAFFLMAMVCHGELMKYRPGPAYLTEFYLWLSVGGVLGGLFNALVAPVTFSSLVEYPLVIVVASLLRPFPAEAAARPQAWLWDVALPLVLGLTLVAGVKLFGGETPHKSLTAVLVFALFAGVVCFSFRHRPLRFGLGVAAILLAGAVFTSGGGRTLFQERNFFGVFKVQKSPKGDFHLITHGSTIHGAQSLDPAQRREPLTYFTRKGPLGQIFSAFADRSANWRIGIVGLGAGIVACYGLPGQELVFYEIDPAVERAARDPRFFTFLADCPAKEKVVLGDARLSLQQEPPGAYDMLIMDAFSSDAIPIHLVTREALQLYLTRIKDDGVIAFHISNRYLDLRPILAALAQDAGLAYYYQVHRQFTKKEVQEFRYPSFWAVMARKPATLAKLVADPRWEKWDKPAGVRWTDDFSNILAVFQWKDFTVKINE